MNTKTKRHFVAVIGPYQARRYGGANYKGAVYENKGRGRLDFVGKFSACTAAHRGEEHEAWCVVAAAFPKMVKRMVAELKARGDIRADNVASYYHWHLREELGIDLMMIYSDKI